MTTEALAGWSALVAAAFTVIGAVTLVLFFSKGQPWGTINDISSIVLMLATIPVALAIAERSSGWFGLAWPAALLGVTGMVGASVTQGLLVARRASYERLLPWTLGFGAVVGVWYVLIGLGSIEFPCCWIDGPLSLDSLAIVSGISFIMLGYGFLRGNERHPLSVLGGVVLLIASTWFLTWFGLLLLGGGYGTA